MRVRCYSQQAANDQNSAPVRTAKSVVRTYDNHHTARVRRFKTICGQKLASDCTTDGTVEGAAPTGELVAPNGTVVERCSIGTRGSLRNTLVPDYLQTPEVPPNTYPCGLDTLHIQRWCEAYHTSMRLNTTAAPRLPPTDSLSGHSAQS